MGDDARAAYERDPSSACRRPGLMCALCLPRAQWCDICDLRDELGTIDEVHVLLDVDGVINQIRWKQPSRSGWSTQKKYRHVFGHHDGSALDGSTESYVVRYSPELVAALNDLALLPGVRFFWLTTWLHEAPLGLSPRIGLNGRGWPVLGKEDHDNPTEPGWWKAVAARRHRAENPHAKIIWLDDDLALNPASGFQLLAIAPDRETGLTPQHISEIRAWIEKGDEKDEKDE